MTQVSPSRYSYMKPLAIALAGVALITPLLIPQTEPLDAPALKALIDGLGYPTKNLSEEKGKEKYEFQIKTGGFNVPIAGEISASKNYIWFTVFLGEPPKDAGRHTALLKENQRVQPNFFYITEKGSLMLAVAVDNRGVTPAIVRRVTDKLSTDVGKTSSIWQR